MLYYMYTAVIVCALPFAPAGAPRSPLCIPTWVIASCNTVTCTRMYRRIDVYTYIYIYIHR